MTALRIILIILLVLWLIGRIRLKGFVEYSEEGIIAQLRVLWFKITLFPPKPKQDKPEKKPKKPKKPPKKPKKTPKPKQSQKPKNPPKTGEPEKPEEPEKPKEQPQDERPVTEKLGGLWSLFRDAVPLVCQAAGKLLHKLRIEDLTLHLTWACEDPADAAMGYGVGEAALGTVWPLLDRAFDIRRRDVGVAVDFTRTTPVIYARALLSFTIGQLMSLGVIYGCKALALFLRHRPKRTKAGSTAETAAANEAVSPPPEGAGKRKKP